MHTTKFRRHRHTLRIGSLLKRCVGHGLAILGVAMTQLATVALAESPPQQGAIITPEPRVVPPSRLRRYEGTTAALLPNADHFLVSLSDKGRDERGERLLYAIRRWDTHSGRAVIHSTVDFGLHRLEASSDGAFWLVWRGPDGIHGLWDVERMKYVAEFLPNTYYHGGLNADGSVAVLSTNRGLSRAELSDGTFKTRLLTTQFDRVTWIAVSDDGSRYVLNDARNGLWLADTRGVAEPRRLSPVGGGWESLAFSRDGTYFSGLNSGKAFIWTVASGEQRVVAQEADRLAVSPDGKSFAMVGRFEAFLYDMDSGKRRLSLTLPGTPATVSALRFTDDGSKLQAVHSDGKRGQYWLWDLKNQASKVTDRFSSSKVAAPAVQPQFSFANWAPGTIRFAADGNSITGAYGRVDLTNGNHRGGSGDPCWIAENGNQVIAKDRHWEFCEYDSQQGKATLFPKVYPLVDANNPGLSPRYFGAVRDMAAHPASGFLATVHSSEELMLWRVEPRRGLHFLRCHVRKLGDETLSVAFAHDGSVLFVGSTDGVAVWDPATGRLRSTLVGPQGEIHLLRLSGDDRRLATFGSQGLKVWELSADGLVGKATLLEQLSQKGEAVEDVAFSPDASRIAVAHQNGTPMVYDVASGKPIVRLAGAESGSYGIAFSQNGGRIAATARDNSLRVWQLP